MIFKLKNNKSKWEITDTIISMEDVVFNQFPEFGDKYEINEPYICIRNYKSSCIYIKESQFKKFLTMSNVYDSENKMANITEILKHTINSDIVAIVANKTSPPAITIKEIKLCMINNVELFISRSIKLEQDNELFKDLMTLQTMKDEHRLK